jgi:hypothetical protein
MVGGKKYAMMPIVNAADGDFIFPRARNRIARTSPTLNINQTHVAVFSSNQPSGAKKPIAMGSQTAGRLAFKLDVS